MQLEGWNIYRTTIFHYGKESASINISIALPAHSVSVRASLSVCVLEHFVMTKCPHKDRQSEGLWTFSHFLATPASSEIGRGVHC